MNEKLAKAIAIAIDDLILARTEDQHGVQHIREAYDDLEKALIAALASAERDK